MLLQQLLVTLIVSGCCAYTAWMLLPTAAKRSAARRLAGWRWPAPIQQRLLRWAEQPGGCGGCNRCDNAGPGKPSVAEQPIRIHRSARR